MRVDDERPVSVWHQRVPGHGDNGLVEQDVQLERVRDAAVIAEGFQPRRFVVGTHERHPADFHQLRSGEKHHLRRIVEQRIDERTLFDDLTGQTARGGGNGGGEPGRSRADNDNVAK